MLLYHDRFLLVVLGVYKQIRNQAIPVMSDVGEDNFDKAFESLRPGVCLASKSMLEIDLVLA